MSEPTEITWQQWCEAVQRYCAWADAPDTGEVPVFLPAPATPQDGEAS